MRHLLLGEHVDRSRQRQRTRIKQQESVQDARRELFIDSIDWVHPPAVALYGASFLFNEIYLPALQLR